MVREQCGDNPDGSAISDDAGPWCSEAENIKKVVIENGITSIGLKAFMGCTKITSVTIPEGVTKIKMNAFNKCTSLTSLVLPSTLKEIAMSVFSECSSLKDIVLPDSLEVLRNGAFKNCTSLTTITIPKNVKRIENNIFEGCTDLKEINVNQDNATYSSYEGVLCDKDKTVIMIFPAGKEVTTYEVPSSIKKIGDTAFIYNENLTEIKIHDGVTYIGLNNFVSSKKLKKINIPSSVEEVGSYLSNCTNLTDVTLGEGITAINGTFRGCTNLININFPSTLTQIGANSFSGCEKLENVELPSGVTQIGQYAFLNCTGLKTIKIPKTVTNIGSDTFKDCTNLTIMTDKDAEYVINYAKANSIKYSTSNFTATVSYSTTNLTNQDVTVTINASEAISKEPDGWNYLASSENKSITKVYTQNGTENVTISNSSGDEYKVDVNVSNIDKTSPVITKEINLALDQKSCDVKLTSNKDIQKVNRMDFI